MSLLFIGSVLDTLEPGPGNLDRGCEILTSAIAPEIGIGAPTKAVQRVSSLFRSLLAAYQERSVNRQSVERSLRQIFKLAAARDFDALAAL